MPKIKPLDVTVSSSESENTSRWTVVDVDWVRLFLIESNNILLRTVWLDHFDLIAAFKVIQVGGVNDWSGKPLKMDTTLQFQFPLWIKNPIASQCPLFCEWNEG